MYCTRRKNRSNECGGYGKRAQEWPDARTWILVLMLRVGIETVSYQCLAYIVAQPHHNGLIRWIFPQRIPPTDGWHMKKVVGRRRRHMDHSSPASPQGL